MVATGNLLVDNFRGWVRANKFLQNIDKQAQASPVNPKKVSSMAILANTAKEYKDPPPHVSLQPSLDGGLTLEVRYWLDYRRNDPLVVQASVGRQIYQAIQSPTEPTSTGPPRKAAGT